MGSSKFSSPFFQKSPLHGAYASGADGMVAQSDRAAFDKLTNDITSTTLTAMKPNISKCKQGAEYYFDKDGAKFMCPEQKNTDNSNRESSEGTGGFARLIYGSAEEARDVKATNDLNTAVETAVKRFG